MSRNFRIERLLSWKLALAVVVAAGTLIVCLFGVSAETAGWLLQHTGYWVLLALFLGLMAELTRRLRRWLGCRWRGRLQAHRWGLLAILAVGVFWHLHEPHRFRVLYDEFAFAGIARSMHFSREAAYPARAHYFNGEVTVLNKDLDKRPFFFSFLISIVHDLTGYRVENSLYTNALLGFVLLLLVYAAGCRAGSPALGTTAVLVLGALPLLAQNVTGAGYDVLNLCMILAAMLAAVNYLQASGTRGLNLMVIVFLLLAQVRYESILYVLLLPVFMTWKWWRTRTLRLTWFTAVAPAFLALPLLVYRVFQAHPGFKESGADKAFFSLQYIKPNLQHAVYYLFNPDLSASNSMLLSLAGTVALVIFLVRALSQLRERKIRIDSFDFVLLAVLAIVAGTMSVALLQFWSAFDDPMASRFSLPLQAMFTIAVVRVLFWFRPRGRALPWLFVVLALRVIVLGTPASAQAKATSEIIVSQEFNWLRKELHDRDPKRTFVLTNGFIGTICWGYPSGPFALAGAFKWKFRRIIERRYYDEVLVFQRFYVQPATGAVVPAERNEMPEGYELETVDEVRFRPDVISRLSRIVKVTGDDSVPPQFVLDQEKKMKTNYDYFFWTLQMLP